MCALPTVDRRAHPRYPLAAGVEVRHQASRRQFPARCMDISSGGMRIYVPAATPVQPGHSVDLQVATVTRPEFAELIGRFVPATVVRVDRRSILSSGHLAIALRFDSE